MEDNRSSFSRGAAAGAFGAVLCCVVIGSALSTGLFDGNRGGLPVRAIQAKVSSLQAIIDDQMCIRDRVCIGDHKLN